MSTDRPTHAEETHSEQEEYDAYGDTERSGEAASFLPAWSRGWWPSLGWRDPPAQDEADEAVADGGSDEDDGFLGGKLVTLLVVGGAILFVVPEPITSGIGILLVALGVIAWLVDWAT